MKNKAKMVFLAAFLLLTACSGAKMTDVEGKEVERFEGDMTVYLVRDKKTGCEYIKGHEGGWTFVHGSCPEVIAKERGAVNAQGPGN